MELNSEPPIVVKLGGRMLDEDLSALWDQIRVLKERNPVVLVHGGGPQATELAARLGHDPKIVNGRRVTTDTDLDIVQWTMRGALNTRLSASAYGAGIRAIGISGADAGTIMVEKRPPWLIDGAWVDFGWVGDVIDVDATAILDLLEAGILPIVAPLGIDVAGRVFNVNADTVAREIAAALGATELLLVTEAGGVRAGNSADDVLIPQCDRDLYEEGVQEGWIADGMRVKVQVAFEALDAGVSDVFILGAHDLVTRKRATKVALSSTS